MRGWPAWWMRRGRTTGLWQRPMEVIGILTNDLVRRCCYSTMFQNRAVTLLYILVFYIR
jgi:hypothetical protein